MSIVTPTDENIARAAQTLRDGGLVAFPTETVYGLGANACEGRAVARVFAAKGRPAFNPLIAHVESTQAARALVRWSDDAAALAHRFWPGALTLILPRARSCPVSDLASAGLGTLAVRVPAHPVAQALLQAAGVPVAAPSANRSGRPSPTTPAHVAQDFGADAPLILAGGATQIGLESTVVDLSGPAPVIARTGSITAQEVARALGREVALATEGGGAPRSPGQLLRHYAPATPVRLRAVEVREGEALLAFGPTRFMNAGRAVAVLNLSEAGDLHEAAANLFAHLRALDRPGHAAIAVMDVPARGIGAAINDRLARAAQGGKGA